jgi:hypothetical protein
MGAVQLFARMNNILRIALSQFSDSVFLQVVGDYRSRHQWLEMLQKATPLAKRP